MPKHLYGQTSAMRSALLWKELLLAIRLYRDIILPEEMLVIMSYRNWRIIKIPYEVEGKKGRTCDGAIYLFIYRDGSQQGVHKLFTSVNQLHTGSTCIWASKTADPSRTRCFVASKTLVLFLHFLIKWQNTYVKPFKNQSVLLHHPEDFRAIRCHSYHI